MEDLPVSAMSAQLPSSEMNCTEDTEDACDKLAHAAVRRIFDDASTAASTDLWSGNNSMQVSAQDAQMRASTASYTSRLHSSAPFYPNMYL
jgi:hypothetical protein